MSHKFHYPSKFTRIHEHAQIQVPLSKYTNFTTKCQVIKTEQKQPQPIHCLEINNSWPIHKILAQVQVPFSEYIDFTIKCPNHKN